MKKVLFLSSALSGLCILAGSLCKMQHWPGANIFFISGTMLLVFIFAPLLSLLSLRDQKNKLDTVSNVTGMIATLFMILSCAGKILSMPGTAVLMVLFTFMLVSFIASSVVKTLRASEVNLRYGLVALLLCCTGSFMMLVSFHHA